MTQKSNAVHSSPKTSEEKAGSEEARSKIVVLISGEGSNLQALIDSQDETLTRIIAVISNKPDAYGLERAQQAGIETASLSPKDFNSRGAYDQALQNCVENYQPDLVILAGFMRILPATFTDHFHGRMMNVHPSLLPKYKGLHTHRRVLEAGEKEHGTTVHFVTSELDGGTPVIQARVPVRPGDTEKILQKRIQQQEYLIYPVAVGWFASGRLRLQGNQAMLDNTPLPEGGFQHTCLSS